MTPATRRFGRLLPARRLGRPAYKNAAPRLRQSDIDRQRQGEQRTRENVS